MPESNEDRLGIEISSPDSPKTIYNIEANKVLMQSNNRNRYLTSEEIADQNLEKMFSDIADIVDFPLLKIRQAQLPKVVPYIPEFPLEIEKDSKTKNYIDKNEVAEPVEKPVETVFVFENAVQNPTSTVNKVVEKYDTSAEADRILRELRGCKIRTDMNIKPTNISVAKDDNKGIGKISPAVSNLMDEVLTLFSLIDSAYEKQGYPMLKKIKKEVDTFATYRKGSTITFYNLDQEQNGLTLVKSHSKKHDGNDVIAIYKRDKKGNIVDVIPICKEKVYRMMKSFAVARSDSFINFVSVNKCLNQEEINSKDLFSLFYKLKLQLEKVIRSIDSKDGMISEKALLLMNEINEKRAKLKEKEKRLKAIASPAFQKIKTGGLFFRGWNKDGENLIYIDAAENKKMPGTVLIKINTRSGEFKKGWLLKDGKVLKNYNGKNNYFPREIKFLTELEYENQGIDTEIIKCLEYINERLDFSDRVLTTYEASRKLANITRRF